jgi:hypothetical protein
MGLAADRLVFVYLAPTAPEHAGPARPLLQFLSEAVARLEATPGIEGATPVNTLPFAGTGGWDSPAFTAEGQGPERASRNPSLNLEAVHPNYFAALKVPLVRARAFRESDGPGEDPIGKRLKLGRPDASESWRTVVGVVKPTRYRELRDPRPTLYLPAQQFTMGPPILVLRTSLPLRLVTWLARARVQAVDPNVEVMRVAPFAELLGGPLARPRFHALLIGVFGVTRAKLGQAAPRRGSAR